MSFCRWSSNNMHCDLYCYEHVDGTFTTHVACNRIVTPVFPHPPLRRWVTKIPGLWRVWSALHHYSVMHSARRPIGLAWDGETIKDDTAADWKETLLMLRAAGYRFPDYVIEAADEEIRTACGELHETRRPT